MANSRLNVANGFVSEDFKNRTFLDKFRCFQFNSHFSIENNSKCVNVDGPGHIDEICGILKALYTFS